MNIHYAFDFDLLELRPARSFLSKARAKALNLLAVVGNDVDVIGGERAPFDRGPVLEHKLYARNGLVDLRRVPPAGARLVALLLSVRHVESEWGLHRNASHLWKLSHQLQTVGVPVEHSGQVVHYLQMRAVVGNEGAHMKGFSNSPISFIVCIANSRLKSE